MKTSRLVERGSVTPSPNRGPQLVTFHLVVHACCDSWAFGAIPSRKLWLWKDYLICHEEQTSKGEEKSDLGNTQL